MTQGALTPTPQYVVSGTGPYAITHGYSAKANIIASVILNDARTELVLDTDFFVAPDSDDTGGNVTLSSGAASTYDGGTLYISRNTVTDQGWAGINGPREASLETQLDKLAQAIQDVQRDLGRALRLDYALGVLALKPNSLLAVDANKQFYAEDPNVLAQLTPDFSATQAYIDSLIAGYQPLAANLTALAGLSLAADTLPYGTASGQMSLATLTAAARTLLAAANAAAQRSALGLGDAAVLGAPDEADLSQQPTDVALRKNVQTYADGVALGVGQTVQNMMSVHSAGIWIQNDTGRTIMVHVRFNSSNGASSELRVSEDGGTSWLVVGTSNGSAFSDHTWPVAPGKHYRVQGSAGLADWNELR